MESRKRVHTPLVFHGCSWVGRDNEVYSVIYYPAKYRRSEKSSDGYSLLHLVKEICEDISNSRPLRRGNCAGVRISGSAKHYAFCVSWKETHEGCRYEIDEFSPLSRKPKKTKASPCPDNPAAEFQLQQIAPRDALLFQVQKSDLDDWAKRLSPDCYRDLEAYVAEETKRGAQQYPAHIPRGNDLTQFVLTWRPAIL